MTSISTFYSEDRETEEADMLEEILVLLGVDDYMITKHERCAESGRIN